MLREVEESWWHRLLAIAAISIMVLAFIVACFAVYFSSFTYVERYSWHRDWIPDRTLERECRIFIYPEINDASTHCGAFDDATELLDDLAKNGAINGKAIPQPRTKLSDAHTLDELLKARPLSTYGSNEFSWGALLKAAGIAFISLLVLNYLLFGLVKLIHYIAHGSNIRLVPPRTK